MTQRGVDAGALIDARGGTRYQRWLVALTALTITFDGIDNQLMGVAIPTVMREWSVPRSAFAPVISLGYLGMMAGGAIAGLVGDRLGRRTALLGSMLMFGMMTMAVAVVDGIATLGLLRFMSGLGLGGAIPNAAALAGEYVPLRHRPIAVTVTIVCVPLGATIAGLAAIPALPAIGWRALFLVGGALPLAAALVLPWLLPESPRFLARFPARRAELISTLRRMGCTVADDATFADPADAGVARASVRELFTPERRGDTVSLWLAFFSCLLAVYLGFSWIPSMLSAAGFSSTVASTGIAAFNLGGVVGALAGGACITRWGSRVIDARPGRAGRGERRDLGGDAAGGGTGGADHRHARVHRRTDQRSADHDVCARRARLSGADPRDRGRHRRLVRAYWRRDQRLRRRLGARVPRLTVVLRRDRGGDDGLHARAGGGAPPRAWPDGDVDAASVDSVRTPPSQPL